MTPTSPRRAAALVVVAVLAVLTLLAGCAGRPPDPPGDEIVWAAGRIDAEGPVAAIAGFWNARHPQGPRVRVVALPEATDKQHQQLSLELGAGLGSIDIAQTDVAWTADLARSGALADLEDMRPELEGRMLPGTLESAQWDGTLWAAPFTTNVGLLYYRKDLVPTAPRTWQEVVDVGRRVGAPRGMAPLVSDGGRGEGLVVQYLEYLWAAGGDLRLDDDGGRFDERAAVDAARFMQTTYRAGGYGPGYESMQLDEAQETFKAGRAVFMRSWPYASADLTGIGSPTADQVGIAALPRALAPGRPGLPGSPAALGGSDLAINRASPDQDAAREVIRFATTSPDAQRLVSAYAQAPALALTYDSLRGRPLYTLVAGEVSRGHARPASPDWPALSPDIAQQVQACYLGATTPEQAVAAIRASVGAVSP